MEQKANLYRLIYVSDCAPGVPCDVAKITDDFKAFSADLSVTGTLWFDGQHFLQLLEGGKDALNTVFKRIVKSPAHTDIDVICFQQVRERIYSDCAMSYFGSQSHNREVAEQFAGGPDLCLRSLPSTTLVEMLRFLEEERQQQLSRCVG